MEQLIIPQPSVPHRTTQERGHSTKRPASVANSHQNYFSTVGNLATKDLEVSQSTSGGHQGSNACTVISLLLAKTYLTNKSFLQLKNHQPLTPSRILAFMSCMMGGNKAYDSFMQPPSFLGVVEAIPLVRSSLGSLSYEDELTVCFFKEPNSSEESALKFHLSRRLTNTNAAFPIINGLTISFVSDANDNIILMYSHLHLPKGAFLATVNLCTVTFINFG